MKNYRVEFVEILPNEHFARKDEVYISAESFNEILDMLLPHQYILSIWEKQEDRYGSYTLLHLPKTKRKK